MSLDKDDSSSIPPPLQGRDAEKKTSLLFVVIAAGAILALVFVTAIFGPGPMESRILHLAERYRPAQ